MDSFYDVPRRVPEPTPIEMFLTTPVVPEVSMICPPKSISNNCMPYHAWKMQQNPNILTSNRQNLPNGPEFRFPSPQNNSQLFKKQVRFESPVSQQKPSLTYEPFNPRKANEQRDCYPKVKSDNELPLNGKTFEEIYMANVPTRQLDLSLVELPRNGRQSVKPVVLEKGAEARHAVVEQEVSANKGKENELPKTYKEFLETQAKAAKQNKVDANDSVTDIFNYKKNKTFNNVRHREDGKEISNLCMDNVNMNTKKTVSNATLERSTSYGMDVRAKEVMRNCIRRMENQNPSSGNPPHVQPLTHQYIDNSTYQSHLTTTKRYSPKLDTETQTSICSRAENVREPDSDPTNKDLLKIIAQQNEQLLILQKQVAMLLNRDQANGTKQIESGSGAHCAPKPNYGGEKCITSTQNENFRSPQEITTPRKRGMSKFSIDLMTSFEVAIRPQHKQNFVNHEPKIQEVTESESIATGITDRNEKTLVDSSLHLQDPVKVREMCPSPEPSININMNDYDSSEDDEVTASDIGATFYRNLMGQVNNILRKAQVQTKEELACRGMEENIVVTEKTKDRVMDRVKEATLKHLQSIGVTIGPLDSYDNSSSENDSRDYSPAEVSFAVKQILMKYLPDDQLAKLSCKQPQIVPTNPSVEEPGIIPPRPEFSFASVQYMKKYNLIASADSRGKESLPKTTVKKPTGPKILDITALKMQPKLL